jgi:signal transduction histidine kinase
MMRLLAPHRPSRRWSARWVLPVAAILAFAIVGTYGASRNQPARADVDAAAIALVVVATAPLLVRDRYPVATLVVAMAASHLYLILGYAPGPIFLPVLIAYVGAVLAGRRVASWIVLAAGYVAFLWARPLLADEPAPTLGAAVGLAAWLLVLAVGAEMLRARRERLAEEARAREEAERRRAGEERMRIARELHDVLAHTISLINVQAGVALHLIDERPEQARTALTAIKQASREALGELRTVLDILRQDGDRTERSPAPSLDRVEELAGRTAAAGVDVRTEIQGAVRPLPGGVDLAAYRIVQEALTNVARHSGAANAVVRVVYGDRDVVVEVEDDGRGGADGGTRGAGKGILGMRERATALGGELDAGPGPGGGFRVRARLPVEGERAGSVP